MSIRTFQIKTFQPEIIICIFKIQEVSFKSLKMLFEPPKNENFTAMKVFIFNFVLMKECFFYIEIYVYWTSYLFDLFIEASQTFFVSLFYWYSITTSSLHLFWRSTKLQISFLEEQTIIKRIWGLVRKKPLGLP